MKLLKKSKLIKKKYLIIIFFINIILKEFFLIKFENLFK